MVAGDTRVLAVATTEKDPELRGEAVRQLGDMGAREELWEIYQKESTPEVKRRSCSRCSTAGEAADHRGRHAEPNAELRRCAVQRLGTMGRTSTGEALVEIYAAEKDPTSSAR